MRRSIKSLYPIALWCVVISYVVHSTDAHSWLECTDYRIPQSASYDASMMNWNKALCLGHARCGQRQANEGFGVDTGFNLHSKSSCQCSRDSSNYNGITKAQYTPGQRVCLAYPSKNHVAAPCTNAHVPDSGAIITRSSVGSTDDSDLDRSAATTSYKHTNGDHTFGQVDYKGFQNCPNFCANMDKSLCTMCFDLEHDIAPGEYTFRWLWSFNSEEDTYSTCWEATVVGATNGAATGGGGGGGGAGTVHAAAASDGGIPIMGGTETPTVAPSMPIVPAVVAVETVDAPTGKDMEELDCDEETTVATLVSKVEDEGSEEPDCEHTLPEPTTPQENKQDLVISTTTLVAEAIPVGATTMQTNHLDCDVAKDP